MNLKRLASSCAVVILTAALTGCAIQPLDFSVNENDLAISKQKINAELKSISVTLSDAGTDETRFAGGTGRVISPFKNALEDALVRKAIFDDEARSKVSITVKLKEFEMTDLFGNNFKTVAAYSVIERKTGRKIYSTEVTSFANPSSSAPLGGQARVREILNLSLRNNIKDFIAKLESVAPEINRTLLSS